VFTLVDDPVTKLVMMSQTACSQEEITAMLRAWGEGDHEALTALVPRVYDELHRQAHRYLRGERANHTLQTSALINEAYLRLAGQRDVEWQNRTHFFGIAASIMRRVLVDYARTQQRVKRGGNEPNLPLDMALSIVAEATNEQTRIDLILLNDALDKLAEIDERQARIVELRYFSGLTVEETAEVLDISEMTVKRDWNVAKAWLRREISSR
jgi:RNA polymerase sigma-70 factor, ECF subfamily